MFVHETHSDSTCSEAVRNNTSSAAFILIFSNEEKPANRSIRKYLGEMLISAQKSRPRQRHLGSAKTFFCSR